MSGTMTPIEADTGALKIAPDETDDTRHAGLRPDHYIDGTACDLAMRDLRARRANAAASPLAFMEAAGDRGRYPLGH